MSHRIDFLDVLFALSLFAVIAVLVVAFPR